MDDFAWKQHSVSMRVATLSLSRTSTACCLSIIWRVSNKIAQVLLDFVCERSVAVVAGSTMMRVFRNPAGGRPWRGRGGATDNVV